MITEPKIVEGTVALARADTFRILIMDTQIHTEQLRVVCRAMGHSVVSAHSVQESFAFLDGADHADVIVCAAYLEDESMFEFLLRLRKNPIHRQTAFMILALEPSSAGIQLNAGVKTSGKILGADAFISMPMFDAARLVAEIKELLPLVPALEECRLKELEN